MSGFIVFLVVFSARQVKKRREETAKQEKEVLARLVRTKHLLPNEIDMLNGLVRHLRKGQRLFELLERSSIFNACVRRYRESEPVQASVLSSLRVKLGFRAEGPERIPHSTAELTPGTQLILLYGKKKLVGSVAKLDEDFLLISVGERVSLPAPGTRLSILLQKRSGLYGFKTVVGRPQGSMVRLRHTEDIQRVQRRKFYRRRTSLPVMLRKAAGGVGAVEWRRTRLKDLGGGGASMEAPGGGMGVGEEVEVAFHLKKGPPVRVRGLVVRLSGNGRVMHIQFGPMGDAQRDRIIAHLFGGMRV